VSTNTTGLILPRQSIGTLADNGAKARFGVAYVRAVCAQAGVGLSEPSPDEDVLASDAYIAFREAPASVQVKCTSQFRIKGGATATWPAEVEWREKWKESMLPVYFVLVVVGADRSTWLDHREDATGLSAAAFWVRIDPLSEARGITVPKSQRLTADTLQEWSSDVKAAFGRGR
jgi:hypothetical protein